MCTNVYIYIHIYIHVHRERERVCVCVKPEWEIGYSCGMSQQEDSPPRNPDLVPGDGRLEAVWWFKSIVGCEIIELRNLPFYFVRSIRSWAVSHMFQECSRTFQVHPIPSFSWNWIYPFVVIIYIPYSSLFYIVPSSFCNMHLSICICIYIYIYVIILYIYIYI